MRETIYGDFAADFVEDRLAGLCDSSVGIQTGPFGSQLHQEDYVEVGTPIVTVEHLGENRILHEAVPQVSDSDRDRLLKYSLRAGDIVFSRVGSVDRRALVRRAEDGWLFSGRCLRVRPDTGRIDSGFLSYFFGLPAFKEHIRAIAVGATMPSLNTSILSDVLIPHPRDISEQRHIAHILGTLDDKIELNRQMSETLEAMAQALFKAWFVDFDPVRAKAEGRDPGLPKPLADLFPDRFEDSEPGEIPAGWEVGAVNNLAEISSGKRPAVRYAEVSAEGSVDLPRFSGQVTA
jgi:type I restriction enzyme S subunit